MSDKTPLQKSHPLGILHEIRWSEICPWLILVKGLRVSLMFRVIFLAYIGLFLSELGWKAASVIFTDPDLQFELASENIPKLDLKALPKEFTFLNSPMSKGWAYLSQPFTRIASVDSKNSSALFVYGLWTIVVWAFTGGAITRIAALQLTRGQSLSLIYSVRFSKQKALSTMGAPLLALLGIAVLSIPLMIAGLLMRLDLLALLTGICWFLILAWGLFVAGVVIGLWFGWPLMWSSISVERGDAFDAISRSYAYVYQRPMHLVFYILVALGLGFLGEAVVYFFIEAALYTSEYLSSIGSGNRRMAEFLLSGSNADSAPLQGMAANGASAMKFWKERLSMVMPAYSIAYIWTSAVAIYLLLRRNVDSTELDEISIDESNEGLPPLEQSS